MSGKKLALLILEDIKAVGERLGTRLPSCRSYRSSKDAKYTYDQVCATFGTWTKMVLASGLKEELDIVDQGSGPKVLFIDIETAPLLVHAWGMWDQTIGLNQIERDWCVLSWAAKWQGSEEIMYRDQRKSKNVRNDKEILKEAWNLLDEADVVVTQNGKRFDKKKLFARFLKHGFKPPSSFRDIDTLVIAKKIFAFTSNKLEYMTEQFNTKYKKLKHKKFPGFELWSECLKGNQEAWKEMETYNKHDVLALEELWTKLRAWDQGINFNVYFGGKVSRCNCGGEYIKNGFYYSNTAKYQRYRCVDCGAEARGRENLLSKRKKESLRHLTKR